MPQPSDTDFVLRHALAEAVDRLVGEFAGVVPAETVGHCVTTSYERFAARPGSVADRVGLTERHARQRLQALGRLDRPDGAIPAVLFLCVHNAGRSQMALGWFNHLAGGRAVAWSGGSEPGDQVNPAAVAAMAEVGIDIAREYPKPWTDEIVRAADVVVTMGCGDACPFYPGTRYEDWTLDDPHGRGIEAVRPIRDEIERRVRKLLTDLGIDPVA
jgi:arsenate reductase (thioredoxin)